MKSLVTACLVPVLVPFFPATALAADAAEALMARPGGDAGLVVLVEPDPGPAMALSADLARTGRHQILILSTRPDVVEQCTAELSRQGVYPVADARLWLRPERLPFPTNAVNMLLLDKPQSDRLGQEEVMRVLVPGHGFALIGAQEQRKPRPQGMDVWLGMNRDATGNRLSRDLLDPPNSIQWLGGRQGAPARVHIISDRVHFIDANTSNDRYRPQFGRPARDTHARDAFSGVTLWNRHHAMGSYINWSFICFSDGQRLFLPVEGAGRRSRQNAPPQDLLMQSLDLHTGQVLQPELPLIRCNQRLRRQEIQQGDWGIHNFFSHRVISDGRRIYHADGGNIIRALSPDGTTLLWENTLPDNEFADMVATDGNVLALVIASTDDNPFASMRLFPRHDNIAKAIVGLDPATGRQRWRYDGVNGHALKFLICDFNTIVAAGHLNDPRKARETARQSGVPSFQQVDNNILVSLDAATGKQHFRRTGRDGFPDVPQLLGHRASLNLGPDHIIFNEANAAYVFDRLTGKTLHEVTAGQHGYFTRHCATTLRWIIHNNVFASYDGSIADQTAHLVAVEDYSGFSKPANNMFYITPGFRSSSSPKWLGDQTALARETSFPPLWPESDRLLVRGTAQAIAQPQPQDWPTSRADFARRA